MSTKQFLVVGFSALLVFVAAQKVQASISVTLAADSVSITSDGSQGITNTGLGTFAAIVSSPPPGSASGSLTVIRTGSSLDYVWAATPDLSHDQGVGVIVKEDFNVSAATTYELAVTGPGYVSGYFLNVDTGIFLEKFGYKSGNVPPAPPFYISGALGSGNYELYYSTGSLPTGPPASGEISLTIAPPVPEPTTIVIWSLLGAVGIGLTWWRKRAR